MWVLVYTMRIPVTPRVSQPDCPYISVGDIREGHRVASLTAGWLSCCRHLLATDVVLYTTPVHSDREVARLRYQGYREAILNADLIPSEAIEIAH